MRDSIEHTTRQLGIGTSVAQVCVLISSDVRRAGEARSRTRVRIATHTSGPDSGDMFNDIVLDVENAVAGGEILHAIREAVVGGHAYLTGEDSSSA